MILSPIADRTWLALILLMAAFGLGFAIALFIPCWCGESWNTYR